MSTNRFTIDSRSFVCIGNGPMHVSPQDMPILVVASLDRPPPHAEGKWINPGPTLNWLSMSGSIWARASGGCTDVEVTAGRVLKVAVCWSTGVGTGPRE